MPTDFQELSFTSPQAMQTDIALLRTTNPTITAITANPTDTTLLQQTIASNNSISQAFAA
jgi:hypothetical protein